METLAKARGSERKVIKQLQLQAKHQDGGDRDAASVGPRGRLRARATIAALHHFEEQIAQNIQEDQRIIVVDAGASFSGWWSITSTKS